MPLSWVRTLCKGDCLGLLGNEENHHFVSYLLIFVLHIMLNAETLLLLICYN